MRCALLSLVALLAICSGVEAVRGNRQENLRQPRRLKGSKSMMKSAKRSKSKSKGDMDDFVVKLTPENEVDPFVGLVGASGIAKVEIDDDKACIDAAIFGFFPMAAHIHFAPIDDNGPIVVDFTPLIEMGKSDFYGCVDIEEDLAERIMERPDLYYVNVHLGGAAPLILQAIRGQLVSSFTAKLENEQTVAPFNDVIEGASGFAMVSFEAAGTTACYDVVITGFNPALGHIHNATRGSNGNRVFNYSNRKVGPGRFTGCQDVTDDNVEGSVEVVKILLEDPSMFYFDYHLTGEEPDIFKSIRGQIGEYEH